MPIKRTILLTAAALTATGLATTTAQAATTACTWQTSVLPMPATAASGGLASAAGQDVYAGVVRYESPDGMKYDYHAAQWTGSAVTDLGLLPEADEEMVVSGVNSSGTVVGTSGKIVGFWDDYPITHYFAWRSRNGHLEQLPVPAGAYNVYATAITENGDVWGYGRPTPDTKNSVVYLWPANQPGTVTMPAGFPINSKIVDVDPDGTVAFNAYAVPEDSGTTRPYLWKNGVATALPLTPGATRGAVSAISNGRAVGQVYEPVVYNLGVLWQNGTVAKLPNSRNAGDINAGGLILGETDKPWGYRGYWQLTTALGQIPAGQATGHVKDDGKIYGSIPRPGHQYDYQPAVSRCS
jgi:uncharacterized membrane protein